jgi:hypothetical protein
MDSKEELAAKPLGTRLVGGRILLDARLQKLRRERHLVEKAITALSELFRMRQSRRRAPRV